jgi:hypothetical protein
LHRDSPRAERTRRDKAEADVLHRVLRRSDSLVLSGSSNA